MNAIQIEIVEAPEAVVVRLIGEAGMLAADALQLSLLSLSARPCPGCF